VKRADIIFALDEYGRWHVFDRSTALGIFDSWRDAADLRDKLTVGQANDDSAPAWTPKSGGY
jgi:hypothetical protein